MRLGNILKFGSLLILFLSFLSNATSQDDTPAFIIGEQEACVGDTLQVAITVENFINVQAFQFALNWEGTELEYINLKLDSSLYSDVTLNYFRNPEDRIVFLLDSEMFSLSDGDTLMTLCLHVISNNNLQPIPIVFENENTPLPPAFSPIAPQISRFIDSLSVNQEPNISDGRITFTNRIQVNATPDRLSCDEEEIELAAMARRSSASFIWLDSNRDTISTERTHIVNEPGLYYVIATDGNCIDTTTAQVVIDTIPPQNVIATGDSFDCQSDAVLSVIGEVDSLEYTWTTPNGSFLTGTNQPVNDEGIYTLNVENPVNGCISTDTALVTTNAILPDAIISSEGVLDCASDNMRLIANSNSTNIDIQWSGGVVDGTDLIITDAGTYGLSITDNDTGCTNEIDTIISIDRATPDIQAPTPNPLTCITTNVELTGNSTIENPIFYWLNENLDTISNTNIASASEVGTYTLGVLNPLNSCFEEVSVVLEEDISIPDISTNIITDTLTCTETSILLEGITSTENVIFNWQNSEGLEQSNNSTMTANEADNYLVIATTTNGCQDSLIVAITQDDVLPQLVLASPLYDTLTCENELLMLALESNPNTSCEWNDGSTDCILAVATEGEYTVSIRDNNNGCIADTTFFIAANQILPVASIQSTDTVLDCVTESLLLSVENPMNNVRYEWVNDRGELLATSDVLEVSEAIGYRLIATDTLTNCSQTSDPITFTANQTAPNLELITRGMLDCSGNSVELLPSTDANYSVVWQDSTGNSVNNNQVSTAGEYFAIITDLNNGCEQSGSLVVEANEDIPSISISDIDTLTCENISFRISATTNADNAIFTWQNPLGETLSTTDYEVSIAGEYRIEILNTDNNCFINQIFNVAQDTIAPFFDILPPSVLDCRSENQQVDLVITSDNPNISCEWEGLGNDCMAQVSQEGIYTATVKDSNNGCSSEQSVSVTENKSIPTTSISTGTITCTDTDALLSIEEPSINVTYEWYDEAFNLLLNGEALRVDDTTTYQLVITDTLSACGDTLVVEALSNLTIPTLDIEASEALDCSGNSVELLPSSNSSYNVIWRDSIGNILDDNQAITAGEYFTIITDLSNGCEQRGSVVVEANEDVPSLSISAIDTLTCDVESIEILASTNAANAIFTWQNPQEETTNATNYNISDAGEYSIEVLNTDNNCSTQQTFFVAQDTIAPIFEIQPPNVLDCRPENEQVDLLITSENPNIACEWEDLGNDCLIQVNTVGTYSAIVTDMNNGCSSEQNISVIENRIAPNVSATAGTLTCVDTDALLSIDNSILNTIYEWRDSQNIIGTGESITVNDANIYELIATDTLNACSDTLIVEVTQDGLLPEFIIDETSLAITCTDSIVDLIVTHQLDDVSIEWKDENDNLIFNARVNEPGFYTVILVNNENGCNSSETIEITDTRTIPIFEIIPSATELTCAQNSITLTTDAETILNYIRLDANDRQIAEGNTLEIEIAGTYIIQATDPITGCLGDSEPITITSNQIVPDVNISLIEAFNCIDEAATIGDTIANNAYSYEWISDNNSIINTPVAAVTQVFESGIYSLRVTDLSNGCFNTDRIEISKDLALPSFTYIELIQPLCGTDETGSININTVIGGQPPYLFAINGSVLNSTRLFSELSPGEYRLSVEDILGCTSEETVRILEATPAEIVVISSEGDEIQLGDETILRLEIANANNIASIIWRTRDSIISEGKQEIVVRPFETTDYFVEVITQNGCQSSTTFRLAVDKRELVYFPTAFSPNGDSENDFFTVFGGQQVRQINQLQIFDRWGEQVFATEQAFVSGDPNYGWNGRLNGHEMPSGVYTFWTEILLIDGRTVYYQGSFQLLR